MLQAQTKSSPKQTNPIISELDRSLLYFIWRHRLATFLALKTVFYPGKSSDFTHYHLSRLKYGGYIQMKKIEGTNDRIFCLAKRGFQLLRTTILAEHKTKGFQSFRESHDLLAAGVLLGPWLVRRPKGVEIVTEQELVNLDVEIIPNIVRDGLTRRPDGLWIFSTDAEKKAVALEVEISAKTTSRYESIGANYAATMFIENVVWVVANKNLASRILEASRKHGIPREGQNLFLLQSDIEKGGWDAKFLNQSLQNTSLGQFLFKKAGLRFQTSPRGALPVPSLSSSVDLETSLDRKMLDCRFYLEKLSAYQRTKALRNP